MNTSKVTSNPVLFQADCHAPERSFDESTPTTSTTTAVRTTSGSALLQHVAEGEAAFEVPKDEETLPEEISPGTRAKVAKGGWCSESSGGQGGNHTGISGLLRGMQHLASLALNKQSFSQRLLRQESEARLKGHRLTLTTIIYNPNAPLRNLFAFQGTALKMVLTRLDFWLLLLLNVAFNIAFYVGTDGHTTEDSRVSPKERGWPEVNIVMIGASGSLLSFFLVFFNGQSYKRFYDQYNQLKAVEHAIANMLFMLRTNFRDGLVTHAAKTRRDVFRYVTSAHYLGLGCLPQYKEDGMEAWAYDHLLTTKVLSHKEVEVLQSRAMRVPFKECLQWALQRLWVHVCNGDLESRIYQAYERHVYEIRRGIQELYNYHAQPIPFAYFHLLNFLLGVYLAVNAYAFVFFSPYWSILGYAVFTLALLGLRELGSAMADPFGDDDSDIPVFSIVNDFFEENEIAIDDPPLWRPEFDGPAAEPS